MKSGWGTFSKVLAWILLISGIFGGIILATELNWYFALIGILGGLVSFCHFGTLGYLADKVSEKTEEASHVEPTDASTPVIGETSSYSDATNNSEKPKFENEETIKETILEATLFTGFRSNYNVKVFLDNSLLGIVSPGVGKAFHSDRLDGTHLLLLEKEDDSNVYASREIEVSNAQSIRIGFTGKADRISIDYIKTR